MHSNIQIPVNFTMHKCILFSEVHSGRDLINSISSLRLDYVLSVVLYRLLVTAVAKAVQLLYSFI